LDLYFFELDLQIEFGVLNLEGLAGDALSVLFLILQIVFGKNKLQPQTHPPPPPHTHTNCCAAKTGSFLFKQARRPVLILLKQTRFVHELRILLSSKFIKKNNFPVRHTSLDVEGLHIIVVGLGFGFSCGIGSPLQIIGCFSILKS
jgi:hypothetical protein